MPEIKVEEVREIATLARLRLTDAEVAKMAQELGGILGYIEEVARLETTNVEPMTHAVPFDCPLREDAVSPSLTVEEALANAPRREANFFQVPRMIPSAGGGGET